MSINEVHVTNYKDYTITTVDTTEKGIFFRSPIQAMDKDVYAENEFYSAWAYLNQLRASKFKRFYEKFLGNKKVVDNIEEWSENMDWGGCKVNILASPIYFNRKMRKLTAICTNPNCNIQKIESYGYESQWEVCSGACVIERTVITLKGGSKIHVKHRDYYHFTYEHIVKDILKTEDIYKS